MDGGAYARIPGQAQDPDDVMYRAIFAGEPDIALQAMEITRAEAERDPNVAAFYTDRVVREERAVELGAEGYPGETARVLEQLDREIGCRDCRLPTKALLYLAAGDTASAIPLLETIATGNPIETIGGLYWRLIAQETLGDIYWAQGEPAKAAPHYAAFAEWWTEADPALQPRVRQARERASTAQ